MWKMRQTVASLTRCFSTSSLWKNVYELSIDRVKPSKLPAYVSAVGPLISEEAGFLGAFTTYLGGQRGEFIYLNEHESGKQLSKSRDRLLEKVRELGDVPQKCISQETIVLHLFPWCEIRHPSTKGGIFEYRSYTLRPGVLAQWSHRFEQGIRARMQYSKPLGIWFSEIGPLNAVHHIWHYEDLDHRMEVRNQALGDELWRETVRDGSVFLNTMMSRIIQPTPYSNWK